MTRRAPAYSSDIEAAMDVLCKARGELPAGFFIEDNPDGDPRRAYRCRIKPTDSNRGGDGYGATISEAIVRAALAAAD